MVATARPIRDVHQYMKLIDFDAVAVTNGAIVICGELITKSTISKSSAERVWRIMCTACDTTVSVEMESGFYANRDIPEWEPIIWKDLNVLPEDETIYKILVSNDREDVLHLVKECVSDELYYSIANGHLIQIMDKRATKWNGIQRMLDFCNCSAEETIYFGDDYDDVEAIRMCGVGVAVSNAIEEVKAAYSITSEYPAMRNFCMVSSIPTGFGVSCSTDTFATNAPFPSLPRQLLRKKKK